ncbi:hypothetical protein BB8028_0001g03600 [Beauveria bassiana]|uniref:DUF7924 domain-containing protein n=1 Tax=Beauveria bassiana TaxID=176275 RepID=A0A2S7XXA4_BEABA|nr:hypothetical protein BB8028_0001g03600 [Beauveria bassiana]
MARTRAQLAALRGHTLSAPKEKGKRPRGIRKQRSFPWTVTARLEEGLTRERDRPVSPSNNSVTRQVTAEAVNRGTKRHINALDQESESNPKRLRRSPRFSYVKATSIRSRTNRGDAYEPINPVVFWTREGKWPQEYFEPEMEHLLARKKSMPSLSRKRSNSASSSTPSDQRPREEKSAPYRDPRYETLLATKGSFLAKSNLDIASASKALCKAMLDTKQGAPADSLFRDDIFETTCQKIRSRNEARVIQDISRLIVPSAESLATFGAKHLDILVESVNEGWNNSVPLAGARPQPDYSVGFARESFTDDQLSKLSPFIGDFIGRDTSFFMATYYMYFPFLTCEVKCGTAALDVADRQNAHSMTLAVRAVTELFRAVKREAEVHRDILAFSVSHDHRSVRIYGHYPVIDGKDTKYYRHPIRTFDFTELDGKEKWTAYRFAKNVYDSWMPSHFKRICSAIDQLPADLDFDNPSLPSTGLSQGLESHHLSQSDIESISHHLEQDSQPSSAKPGRVTPNTSFTDSGPAKKRMGKK